MTTNKKLLNALQKKMSAEQDEFRDWLLTQPPEEILNHTFEYSVREDIVMLMDQTGLSNSQLRLLLASPAPLGDVYKVFSNLDMSLVDTLQSCMEASADAVRRAELENQKNHPKKKSVLRKLQDKASEPPRPHAPAKDGDAR